MPVFNSDFRSLFSNIDSMLKFNYAFSEEAVRLLSCKYVSGRYDAAVAYDRIHATVIFQGPNTHIYIKRFIVKIHYSHIPTPHARPTDEEIVTPMRIPTDRPGPAGPGAADSRRSRGQ